MIVAIAFRGRARQVDVALGDRTDAAVDDLELESRPGISILNSAVLEGLDEPEPSALAPGERGLSPS